MDKKSIGSISTMLLVAYLFALPLAESPKNILLTLYFISWALERRVNFGGNWNNIDTSIVFFIMAGIISTKFGAAPSQKGIIQAGDILSYSLLFLTVSRTYFSENEIKKIQASIIISTIIAIAYGMWRLYIAQSIGYLKINSVGHVNHGAIYIATALSLVLSITIIEKTAARTIAYFIFMLAALLITASRGAIIPFIVFFLFSISTAHQRRKSLILTILILLTVGVTASFISPEFVTKTTGSHRLDSYRIDLANTALAAFSAFPLNGVGLGNFYIINQDTLSQWHSYFPSLRITDSYFYSSHAHSLYFNTLAERGFIGIAALSYLFITINLYTYKHRSIIQSNLQKITWLSAHGASFIVLLGGLFNTTLHHEHGALAMCMLGLAISQIRQSKQPKPRPH